MNDNLYISWIADSFKNSYLTQSTEIELAYFHYLTPFSSPFAGPLNPLMLFCGYSKKALKEKNSVMIRDGLIPLTYFFRDLSPDDFDCTFYVHANFWFLVPEVWRPKVKFYTQESKVTYHAGNLPRKILLMGTLNSTFADGQEFKDEIKKLVASLGGREALRNIEIAAYFSFKRNDLWGSWDDENILEYSKTLFNEMKLDISFPSLENIMSENDFRDVLYHEVNKRYFIAESYPSQVILSRGGGLLRTENVLPLELEKSVNVSLNHKLNLYKLSAEGSSQKYQDPFKEKIFLEYRKFFESFTRTNKSNHWDSWFASYVKSYYKKVKKD